MHGTVFCGSWNSFLNGVRRERGPRASLRLRSSALHSREMKMAILAAGQGSRLRTETGGRPKLLLDVAGRTLLDRQLDIACRIGAEPLVVTRLALAEDFRRTGMEVLVEEEPAGILGTLYHARGALDETFCWLAGDMLFTDPVPMAELVAAHLEQERTASFFH